MAPQITIDYKEDCMKWYALFYDVNKKKVTNLNIFDNINFSQGIDEMRERIWNSIADFIEQLDSELKYSFWSKAEYELEVNGEKIDIYSQVKPNEYQLARYILNYWANNPRQ